ncbi:MAG: hypothetical protein RR555_07350 [Bacteroidales bacterium]
MNIGKVFLLVFALCIAQGVSGKDVEKKNYFFIGAAGGVHLYEGADDHAFGLGNRLSPALDVYVGKWFNPWVGGRVSYSGLSAQGWSPVPTAMAHGEMVDGWYKEEFSTMYFHADFMWNISNTISGYKRGRFWDFVPYLGVGYMHFKSKAGENTGDEIAASVGLYNTLSVSRMIDITLDVRQTAFSPRWINALDDSKFNYLTSATIGIAFKIGNRDFRSGRSADVAAYTAHIRNLYETIRKNMEQADKMRVRFENENARLKARMDSLRSVTPTVIERDVRVEGAYPIALFFEVGKPDLGAKEIVNLRYYVENIICPNPDRIFTITGVADNSSGKRESNKALAQRRVQYVYDLLISDYGVQARQLCMDGVVGEDMFPDSRLNRVVIIK